MASTNPAEPQTAGELGMFTAVRQAPSTEARLVAMAYLARVEDLIDRHILGGRLSGKVRAERWSYLVAILDLDGERLPSDWQDWRVGARALRAAICEVVGDASRETACLPHPRPRASAATHGASRRPSARFASRAASAVSTGYRPAS